MRWASRSGARTLTGLGLVGPDPGMGGRYLILGFGQEEPDADRFVVVRSATGEVLSNDIHPILARAGGAGHEVTLDAPWPG